jgi:hypothetical protein
MFCSTDCVTIFLNVVARGGTCTVRWNRYITPDLCLATSWLHDLIYSNESMGDDKRSVAGCSKEIVTNLALDYLGVISLS